MTDNTDREKLIEEAREFVNRGWFRVDYPSASSVITRLADALEATTREMHARELHHFETEQAITEALRIDTHHMHPDARRVLSAALEAAEKALTPTDDEPIAYAIYGRVTGNLKYVQVMDEQEVKEQSEFYDVAPLFHRTVVPEPSTMAEMIERSSFGTPEVQVIRATVSDEKAAALVAEAHRSSEHRHCHRTVADPATPPENREEQNR